MKRDYRDEFGKWKEASLLDDDLVAELNVMEENEAEMEDAFYKDLAFGTGGLRGVIGAGTNRMKVSQWGRYSLTHFLKKRVKL